MKHIKLLYLPALLLIPITVIHAGATKDYPIQPVPFTAVRVQDAFWTPRLETNRLTTVWYDFQRCEETGRIDNFAKAAGSVRLFAGHNRLVIRNLIREMTFQVPILPASF